MKFTTHGQKIKFIRFDALIFANKIFKYITACYQVLFTKISGPLPGIGFFGWREFRAAPFWANRQRIAETMAFIAQVFPIIQNHSPKMALNDFIGHACL